MAPMVLYALVLLTFLDRRCYIVPLRVWVNKVRCKLVYCVCCHLTATFIKYVCKNPYTHIHTHGRMTHMSDIRTRTTDDFGLCQRPSTLPLGQMYQMKSARLIGSTVNFTTEFQYRISLAFSSIENWFLRFFREFANIYLEKWLQLMRAKVPLWFIFSDFACLALDVMRPNAYYPHCLCLYRRERIMAACRASQYSKAVKFCKTDMARYLRSGKRVCFVSHLFHEI